MKCLKWFLVALAFFLLTLVFVIVLMSKGAISDAAMDNVSFASAVVSIVLAVLSIIISMYASFSTQGNLGSMKEIEHRLDESIGRLKDLKKDIDDFRAQIVPNIFGQQAQIKANGKCFMMLGVKNDKVKDSTETNPSENAEDKSKEINVQRYMMLSERALDKIQSLYNCPISRNFRLRDIPSVTFDGYTMISDEPYVFEVKVTKSPNQALVSFRRYLEGLRNAFENLRLRVSVVVVAVCKNEKEKNETLDLLTRRLVFPNLNLSILCFTQSEVETSDDSACE